jgi:hypothetical protein
VGSSFKILYGYWLKLAFQFFTDSQAVRIKPEAQALCCVSPILRTKVPVRVLKDFSTYPDDWSPLLLSFPKIILLCLTSDSF